MLTLVFVFMLFNLTSIWNLPTLSIGEHVHDGGPGARFFEHGHAQKASPQGIRQWGKQPTTPCLAAPIRMVNHLPSQLI